MERLGALLMREPEDRDQLITLLHSAYERHILDADVLSIVEGALQMSELQARDIMVPRAQMDVIDINESPEKFIPTVIETAHSRFPVIDGSKDKIVGILLAKDLLRYYAGEEFNVRDMLRPAIFIPESKRLNVLLREFRSTRNHIAIVVDEYGGASGLLTMEDVLEQIVGDIVSKPDVRYRVKATTEIADLNDALGTRFSDEDFDTVGGLVVNGFERVPKRGEEIVIEGLRFKVLRADSRRVHSLLVDRISPAG